LVEVVEGAKRMLGAAPEIPNAPPQPLRLGVLRHHGSHSAACGAINGKCTTHCFTVTWPADEAGAREGDGY
jgi:hypothetical protein